MSKIEFLVQEDVHGVVPEPYPASRLLPSWFRKMPAYPTNMPDDVFPIPTVKRCPPVKDAMTLGYIIPLPWAIRAVADEEVNVSFSWVGETGYGNPIQSHSVEQLDGFPIPYTNKDLMPFKFNNPWIIRTEPGWSTLFLQPINYGERRFTVFTGLVDTDVYFNGINFPFLWNKYPCDEVLDAGTPIAQAIPIQRSELSHEVRAMTQDENNDMHKHIKALHSHQHHYARNVRCPRNGHEKEDA